MAAGSVRELTSKNFDEFISDGKCAVDFWAEWCGPCKMLAPIFLEAAEEFKGKIKFGKINVENEPELAERFMVMSVPAIILFKGGKQIDRINGVMPKEELIEKIEETIL
jgi:thioredoxin 1